MHSPIERSAMSRCSADVVHSISRASRAAQISMRVSVNLRIAASLTRLPRLGSCNLVKLVSPDHTSVIPDWYVQFSGE